MDLGDAVDAGGEVLLNELFGQRVGVEASANRGQDDDGLHLLAMRSAASFATSRTAARYWRCWKIGTTAKPMMGPSRRPNERGTRPALRFDHSKRSTRSSVLPS